MTVACAEDVFRKSTLYLQLCFGLSHGFCNAFSTLCIPIITFSIGSLLNEADIIIHYGVSIIIDLY